MANPLTEGERLLAAYFHRRRLPVERERNVNGRRPDFSVDYPTLGHLVFEVYEPEIRLPKEPGAFDAVPNLQGAFERRKRQQIVAVKSAGLPYIAVVTDTNSDIPIDPL